jgi:hypothetical protein
VTPASLPEHVERLQDLVERKQEGGPPLGREEARERAKGVVGSALVVALADAGWTIAAPPGEPLVATRGGSSLQPNALLEQLVKGELDADAWRRTWADAGIAAVELVPGAKAEEPKRATKTRRRPTGA